MVCNIITTVVLRFATIEYEEIFIGRVYFSSVCSYRPWIRSQVTQIVHVIKNAKSKCRTEMVDERRVVIHSLKLIYCHCIMLNKTHHVTRYVNSFFLTFYMTKNI